MQTPVEPPTTEHVRTLVEIVELAYGHSCPYVLRPGHLKILAMGRALKDHDWATLVPTPGLRACEVLYVTGDGFAAYHAHTGTPPVRYRVVGRSPGSTTESVYSESLSLPSAYASWRLEQQFDEHGVEFRLAVGDLRLSPQRGLRHQDMRQLGLPIR